MTRFIEDIGVVGRVAGKRATVAESSNLLEIAHSAWWVGGFCLFGDRVARAKAVAMLHKVYI